MIRALVGSPWTWRVVHAAGFALLAAYLVLAGDWRISILWALAYVGISLGIAWLFASLGLPARFPALDRMLLAPQGQAAGDMRSYVNYLDAGLGSRAVLLTPAEDGLVCVPLLLAGINPFTALAAGAAFGALNVGRFTYLDCITKGVIYALICILVLPHGLLTVVLGHFAMNGLAFIALQHAKGSFRGVLGRVRK